MKCDIEDAGAGLFSIMITNEKIPFGAKTWIKKDFTIEELEKAIERIFKAVENREGAINLALGNSCL